MLRALTAIHHHNTGQCAALTLTIHQIIYSVNRQHAKELYYINTTS